MNYIKGKIRNIIYQNKDNGYVVAVFRIKETNDAKMEEYVSKTVTITGTFLEINSEETFILYGEATRHERFGFQYQVKSYEKEKISSEDALIEFLSSSLIKGSGEVTAKKIVKFLGMDAIDKIKNDEFALRGIPNLSEAKQRMIRESLLEYSDADDSLLKLKELGFSIPEATRIYKKYGASTKYIIDSNLYVLTEIMDFNKVDAIYKSNHEELDRVRIKACMVEAMRRLSINNGDTYYKSEEIKDALKKEFDLLLDEIEFEEIMYTLEEENKVVLEAGLYYLVEYYDAEVAITDHLFQLSTNSTTPFYDFDHEIALLEEENKVYYNEDQRNAIKKSFRK